MFRAPGRIDRSIRSVESIVREFSCRLRGKSGTAGGGIRGTDVSSSISNWPVRGNCWKTLSENVVTHWKRVERFSSLNKKYNITARRTCAFTSEVFYTILFNKYFLVLSGIAFINLF